MNINYYDVLIIGGGYGGIFTLKYCLEENLKVLLLEKNNEYGGVWNINNSPSVYANTYSVTSKYYLSITDYPIPEEYPEFPHHSLVYEYMKNYVKHFKLEQYMSLNSNVIQIYKEKNIESESSNIINNNNLWNISYKKNFVDVTVNAKNIILCTGQNSRCINMPDINYSKFKGKIIHASEFDETFRNKYCLNKSVLVFGGSDTAADIADELTNNMYSNYGKNNNYANYGSTAPNDSVSKYKTIVYMSMCKGRWFQRRNLGTNPADMFYNRIVDTVKKIFGKQVINDSFPNELQLWWGKGGSQIKEWYPKAGYLNSYYVKSSNVVNKVSLGEIIPKACILEIKENSVVFESINNKEDIESEQNKENLETEQNNEVKIDTIIFATGYKGMKCFNEIPEYITNGKYYDHIFLIEDPSVVKIGFIRPYLTSIPMIIEMQARYVSQVFSNKIKLPTKDIMEQEYKNMKDKQSKEFSYDYERVQGIIDPYDYMDIIANKIGAVPNLLNILVEDPQLFYLCMFGSWSHYYYTLNDKNPTKKQIAKEQFLILKDNPTSQQISGKIQSGINNVIFIIIIIIVLLFIYMLKK